MTKHLNRARHRGKRIPDLVGNACRHLANRRKTLLQPRIPLQPAHVGHVLEGEEEPCPSVRKRQRARGQTEVDRAAVTGAMLSVDPERARVTKTCQSRPRVGRQLQHVDRVAPDRSRARNAEDDGRRTVEREDAALCVGRHQATEQAVDDVLVVLAKIADLVRRVLETRTGGTDTLSQGTSKQGNREEAAQVDGDGISSHAERWQFHNRRETFGELREADVHVLNQHERQIQHRAQARDL